MDSMKRYRCPNGHVVGLIRSDGHSVSRLLYLRESLDESQDALPKVAAIIDSGDVTCTICGASMVWSPSLPALLRLLDSHKKLRDGLRNMMIEQAMENSSFLERG